jgi:hypothetical protein
MPVTKLRHTGIFYVGFFLHQLSFFLDLGILFHQIIAIANMTWKVHYNPYDRVIR